jgi:hypothetical protein
MGSVASLEKLIEALAARAVDVVTGFVDLPAQGLPLLRRKPALASAVGLATVRTIAVLALLSTRVWLGRLLLLLRRIIAGVVGVALLRQPVSGAS